MFRLWLCSIVLALIFSTVAEARLFQRRSSRRSGGCVPSASSVAGGCSSGQCFVR